MKGFRLPAFLLSLLLALCLISPALAAGEDAPSLEQAIVAACTYGKEADLTAYDMTVDELTALYTDLFHRGALPWYASTEYQYTYNEETEVVSTFRPDTDIMESADLALYEQTVAQILDACVKPGMEDWQIALALHDHLIANAEYDETLLKTSSYDLLVEGTAVCSGYASAYQDLLLRVGIECRYVVSEKMDHAWNLVKIDGKWYHVDLTWDDPTPDGAGYVSHRYFLRTDNEMVAGEKPHYDWNSDIACTDTRFSEGFWLDVCSPIIYESAEVCYLVRLEDWYSTLYRRKELTGIETPLYKEPEGYVNIGQGNYAYEHHGLSLRQGRLWFCTNKEVLSVKTDGSDLQSHYTHTGSTYIYGCFARQDMLNLTFMTHDSVPSHQQISLPPTGEHVHAFTQTVTKPTCTEPGYTMSVCACGMECKSTPTAPKEHSYLYTDGEKATLSEEGYGVYTCEYCDHSYTEILPKLQATDILLDNLHIVIPAGLILVGLITLPFRRKRS